MLEQLQQAISHPLAQSALTGLLGAATVDIAAFRAWKDWHEAAAYNWQTASWRWFQGAAVGLLTGLGLAAVA